MSLPELLHQDPLDEIKPRCLTSCADWLQEYNSCVSRINMRTDGKGDCKGQFEELTMCQDHGKHGWLSRVPPLNISLLLC